MRLAISTVGTAARPALAALGGLGRCREDGCELIGFSQEGSNVMPNDELLFVDEAQPVVRLARFLRRDGALVCEVASALRAARLFVVCSTTCPTSEELPSDVLSTDVIRKVSHEAFDRPGEAP